jgi:hypothetical protein
MKISKGYGTDKSFVFRCRFFTLIIHFHAKKDWKRQKARSK